MIKKTVVEGRELRQVFTSPTHFLHNFFETRPVEAKPIRAYTEEYRKYRKKIVSEGRLTRWGGLQPIKERKQRR